jgi:hypothetical protein
MLFIVNKMSCCIFGNPVSAELAVIVKEMFLVLGIGFPQLDQGLPDGGALVASLALSCG